MVLDYHHHICNNYNIDIDDYLKRIYDFTMKFSEEQNTDELKAKIDSYINQ